MFKKLNGGSGKRWNRERAFQKIPIDRSQAKCLADLVLLYLRYAVSDVGISKEASECAELLYKEFIRGEIIKNPRITAAAILYIAIVLRLDHHTQADICEALYINENSLRIKYKELKKELSKHEARLLELSLWDTTSHTPPTTSNK